MSQEPGPVKTRDRILAKSLEMFNATGEPNVTTNHIADELEISPGNLYYHFRNKDDIVNALFEQFEREIDPLLDAPKRREIHFEDAWLFLHLLFESIWRYRFIYRDVNDLLSRNRRLELHFRTILERKNSVARLLCEAMQRTGQLHANDTEIAALATNMVVVATWWLSFEFVTNARHFNETGYQNAAMARGAYQVLAMLAPFLSDEGRVLFQRLAREYLSA